MSLLAAFTLAFLAPPQEDKARDLVQRLNADSVAEREAATRGLLELGESARGILEETARHAPNEASQRAREILGVLDMRRRLGPRLLNTFPGLDRDLLNAEDHEWTKVFLEATEQRHLQRRHPELSREDLDILSAAAVRGATPGECHQVWDRVAAWNLRSGVPEMIKLLPGAGMDDLHPLVYALRELKVPEASPLITKMLREEKNPQKWMELYQLTVFPGDRKEFSLVLEMVRQGHPRRDELEVLLVHWATEESIPDLLGLLERDEPPIGGLGQALARLNVRKAIPLLKERILEGSESSRRAAVMALCEMRHRAAVPEILALFKNEDTRSDAIARSIHESS